MKTINEGDISVKMKNYPIFLDKSDFKFWDDLDVINKCILLYFTTEV